LFIPRIPQDPNYHNFADKRVLFLNIPNTLDVMSNIPFIFVGLYGLHVLLYQQKPLRKGLYGRSSDSQSNMPYILFFGSLILIAFGSMYYHWNPTTKTLFWDRLPMTLAFMSMVCAVIMERWDPSLGKMLLIPCNIAGVCSVVYWIWTEQNQVGDLRPYIIVQFLPILLSFILFGTCESRYTHSKLMVFGVFFYVLAKIAEVYDFLIFRATYEIISGHTLKHLLAVVGAFVIGYMLSIRRLKKENFI
jgi:hypothetical protein